MDAMKLLGSLLKNQSLSSGLGQQLLGGLLGGGQSQRSAPGGGLAGILGSVLGGGGAQSSGGGAADLLGSILGGGGRRASAQPPAGGNLIGSILGSVLGGGAASAPQAPTPIPQQHQSAANDQAVLMIRAMVNAAKADGRVDNTEQEKILSKLGDDISQDEVDFLKSEFAAPLDVRAFADSVPDSLEPQIYALSLTSIELDTQNEAQYLGQLAQHMELDPNICNQIHDQVGAPRIFG